MLIERKFGRLESFDERSRNFNVRKLIRLEAPETRLWECTKVLDQGSMPTCVGFAGAHQAIAVPIPQSNITDQTGILFYRGAQKYDEWPGEDYDGSSGLGLLKYWLKLGFCKSGYWAFNLLEHRLGIAFSGPALVGSKWMTGMMKPDSNGFVHATGVNEGGHETLWLGNNEEKKHFTILNSWYDAPGIPWGQNGRAKISFDDAEKLRSGMDVLFIEDEQEGWDPVVPDPEDEKKCFIAKGFEDAGNFFTWLLGSRYRIKTYRKEAK